MFDIGWTELFVIGVLVLLVTGPRDLPKVLYEIGKWVRRARAMAREFQGHVDGMMREVELEELRKEAEQYRNFDIREELKRSLHSPQDPSRGDLKRTDPTTTDASRPDTAQVHPAQGGSPVAGQGDRAAKTPADTRSSGVQSSTPDWLEAGLDGADQMGGGAGTGYPFEPTTPRLGTQPTTPYGQTGADRPMTGRSEPGPSERDRQG